MSLRKILRLRHTLALRLTLWYASIFTVSSVLAFALVYVLIVSLLQQRIDNDLHEDIEEFAVILERRGLEGVRAKMEEDTEGEEARDAFFRLWGADGTEVMHTRLSAWRGLVPPPLARSMENEAPQIETLHLDHRRYRARTIYGSIGSGLVLQIGQSQEEDELFTEILLQAFFVAFAAIVVLVSPIGWFLARRALRGVEEVTHTAIEIAHGALDQRVTVRYKGDELDRLAQTFNHMLDRIQLLILGMREMTDNLAHDLRTPLGRIRASAEMALTGDEAEGARKSLALNTIEQCDRLLEIINTTLDIAEAESGAAKLRLSEVDLAGVVRDACELFQTVAEDKHITLAANLPDQCRLQGDLPRVQRAVANLIDNALKYTPAGGRVDIDLVGDGAQLSLSVRDTGVGIAADDLPRIFRRFYRTDRSRSQAGYGLGLSLARAFVVAHGGDISATSTPGQGSTFTMTLPRTPATHA